MVSADLNGRRFRSMKPFFQFTDDELQQRLVQAEPTSIFWHGATAEIQRRLLCGDATWAALELAVNNLIISAPQDHDILIQVRDISVLKARFIKPHTFLFEGIDQNGHRTGMVLHFSQVEARVVYLPKRGPDRVITGFATI